MRVISGSDFLSLWEIEVRAKGERGSPREEALTLALSQREREL